MRNVPPAAVCLAACLASTAESFAPTAHRIRPPPSPSTHSAPITCARTSPPSTSTSLAGYNRYGNGRSSPRNAKGDRTKRQERVGHVVRSELAGILSRSTLKNDDEPIESELRRRINVVHADVSPDLRQARITVSIMAVGGSDRGGDAIAKRRAYAWLVRNTKAVRHALAGKMAHMRGGAPELTFVQVDVGAAVDVMNLIDKVSEGYKRDDVLEMEDWAEEDEDDDGWFDFDEDGEGISVEVEV